jgi:hypothetical protein
MTIWVLAMSRLLPTVSCPLCSTTNWLDERRTWKSPLLVHVAPAPIVAAPVPPPVYDSPMVASPLIKWPLMSVSEPPLETVTESSAWCKGLAVTEYSKPPRSSVNFPSVTRRNLLLASAVKSTA